MKLHSAALKLIGGDVISPIHNAKHRWSSRQGLLLTLQADGFTGLGEASPLPGYSMENLVTVTHELQNFLENLREIPTSPSMIELRCQTLSSASARFAAETAMLDLLAHACSCSLHHLFRPTSTKIRRSGLLQASSLEGLVDEASVKLAEGISCLKLKIGALSIFDEIARIRALSSALSPSVILRLDANGAYSPTQTQALLTGLKGISVDVIEEPVTPKQWGALYECSVYGNSGLLPHLAGDESLLEYAAEQLANPLVTVLVLKPASLGFFGALRLAREGIRQKKHLIVTHLFDGPVSLAAACELALSLPQEALLPCGLDKHHALISLGNLEIPQLIYPGYISATQRHGLGISLEAITRGKESLSLRQLEAHSLRTQEMVRWQHVRIGEA